MENVISEIGQLWKLVAFIILGIALFIFREPIKSILMNRNLRIKKGDTEFEVNGNAVAKVEQTITKEQAVATIDKMQSENDTEEKDNFGSKLIEAFANRNEKELNKAISDIDSSELDFNEKIKYKAVYYRMCHTLGDTEALNKLEEFADKYKESKGNYVLILEHLASIYIEINQHEKAFEVYEEAINNCEDVRQRAKLISKSALCALDLKLNEKSINILIDAINKEKCKDALYIYYKNLATIYGRLEEKELKVITLEKALQYYPNNTDDIFDAAFTYSENSNKDLALLHYSNLLKFAPNNADALNNKGVVCYELGLNGMKIDLYKRAIENGNSLASSNIALEYIDKGFYDEAKKILKEASSLENPHINVNNTITRLNEAINSEGVKEKEIIKQAIIKQRFLIKFADAYFNECNNLNISNCSWKFGENVLDIKQVDNRVEGIWSENGVYYKFEGNIINRAVKTRISKKIYDFTTKTYIYKEIGIAYVYISNNNNNDKLYMLTIESGKENYIVNEFEKFIKEEY